MKFLIDAHLPPSPCRALAGLGHDAVHTSDLPTGNATKDEILIRVAVEQGRVLVTGGLAQCCFAFSFSSATGA